jgi:hypothetical protein
MRGLTAVLALGLVIHACVEAHAAGGAYVVDNAAVDDPFACKIETRHRLQAIPPSSGR